MCASFTPFSRLAVGAGESRGRRPRRAVVVVVDRVRGIVGAAVSAAVRTVYRVRLAAGIYAALTLWEKGRMA